MIYSDTNWAYGGYWGLIEMAIRESPRKIAQLFVGRSDGSRDLFSS